jgi:hypothetical protein
MFAIQKRRIGVGLLVFAVLGLFPPWVEEPVYVFIGDEPVRYGSDVDYVPAYAPRRDSPLTKPTGPRWSFLFSTPAPSYSHGTRVRLAWGWLVLEWLAVAIAVYCFMKPAKIRPPPQQGREPAAGPNLSKVPECKRKIPARRRPLVIGMSEDAWRRGDSLRAMIEAIRGKVTERECLLFSCACCRRVWHLLREECCRHAVEVAELFADGLASKEDLTTAYRMQSVVWARARKTLYEPGGLHLVPDLEKGEWSRRRIASVVESARARAQFYATSAVGFAALPGYKLDEHVSDDTAEAAEAEVMAAEWSVVLSAFDASEGTRFTEELAGAQRYHQNWLEQYRRAWEKRVTPANRRYQIAILLDIIGDPFRSVSFEPGWRTGPVKALAQAIYDDRSFNLLPRLANEMMDAGCTNIEILAHCRSCGEHARGCWVLDLILGES